MSQPPLPFRLGAPVSGNPFSRAVKATLPSLAATPVTTSAGATTKRSNPFLSAMNTESQEFKENYGVNKPLKDAMFLGYRDEKPVFGGGRLFILY
ncbi:hypothetical protein [Vampirovibrio sp.]|uniref:hypothetical protein n=1 Tax=Vampirovibrio sp. TaxID=2717857 RepID=UPI0035943C4B